MRNGLCDPRTLVTIGVRSVSSAATAGAAVPTSPAEPPPDPPRYEESFVVRGALSVRSMAHMGSHRAIRPGVKLTSANPARHSVAGVDHPYADGYGRRSEQAGVLRGSPPMRPSRKLLVLVAAVVIAIIAVVAFAASAAAHRTAADRPTSARTTADQTSSPGSTTSSAPSSAGSAGTSAYGITAVPAGLGLTAGAVSPNAPGIPAAMAALPKLDAFQLAGQRVIYSYTGLTPPSLLLWNIRHGRVAGVIFFKDNIGSNAHIKAVVKQLQQANAASTNPVRAPLLLMTDQEGGIVRRLDG